jgi:hypothetical protein
MASSIEVRNEPPLIITQFVYRGGKAERGTIFKAMKNYYELNGVWGISVVSHSQKSPETLKLEANGFGFGVYPQYRRATVGEIQNAGWQILATGDQPHYTLVLPRQIDDNLWSMFNKVFSLPIQFGGINETHN